MEPRSCALTNSVYPVPHPEAPFNLLILTVTWAFSPTLAGIGQSCSLNSIIETHPKSRGLQQCCLGSSPRVSLPTPPLPLCEQISHFPRPEISFPLTYLHQQLSKGCLLLGALPFPLGFHGNLGNLSGSDKGYFGIGCTSSDRLGKDTAGRQRPVQRGTGGNRSRGGDGGQGWPREKAQCLCSSAPLPVDISQKPTYTSGGHPSAANSSKKQTLSHSAEANQSQTRPSGRDFICLSLSGFSTQPLTLWYLPFCPFLCIFSMP